MRPDDGLWALANPSKDSRWSAYEKKSSSTMSDLLGAYVAQHEGRRAEYEEVATVGVDQGE